MGEESVSEVRFWLTFECHLTTHVDVAVEMPVARPPPRTPNERIYPNGVIRLRTLTQGRHPTLTRLALDIRELTWMGWDPRLPILGHNSNPIYILPRRADRPGIHWSWWRSCWHGWRTRSRWPPFAGRSKCRQGGVSRDRVTTSVNARS